MARTELLRGTPEAGALLERLRALRITRVLLVCDPALEHLRIRGTLATLEDAGVTFTRFSDFTPNPKEESVAAAAALLKAQGCGLVWGIGGGSAMDVAKCVRLRGDPALPLWLMPTTAGTGSEADHFAVIYRDGVKQSVSDGRLYPDLAILDPSVLDSLPEYQKKATLLDALCHGIESIWSLRSNPDSRSCAVEAIRLIRARMAAYLSGDRGTHADMLWAAHLAGRAIDGTTTTAGHAMCYKLTSLYGLAHGHAAALCVDTLWPWMLAHPERRAAALTEAGLILRWHTLAEAFECPGPGEAQAAYHRLLTGLALPRPALHGAQELAVLTASVNPERLGNHPFSLTPADLETLYRSILL